MIHAAGVPQAAEPKEEQDDGEDTQEDMCEVIRTGPKYQAFVPDWVQPIADSTESEKGHPHPTPFS